MARPDPSCAIARPGIFFASGPVNPALRLFDWKTNHVRDVWHASGKLRRGPRGPAVAPDGSRIVYMREDVALGRIEPLEKIE